MGGNTGAPAAPRMMPGSTMMRGGPSAAPSMYAQPQAGMSSMIAALRGNTPMRQVNPGVTFMANQPNAPTTPMTSYLRGQQMMQQMAQQPSQPSPVQPAPQPIQSGVKGLVGPVPQQSIGQGPQLSASGLTFNPQRLQIPVAPPMPEPVVAPVAGKKGNDLTESIKKDGLMAALARQQEQQSLISAAKAVPTPAPAPAPMVARAPVAPPVAPVVPVMPPAPAPAAVAPRPAVAPVAMRNQQNSEDGMMSALGRMKNQQMQAAALRRAVR